MKCSPPAEQENFTEVLVARGLQTTTWYGGASTGACTLLTDAAGCYCRQTAPSAAPPDCHVEIPGGRHKNGM